MIEKYIDQDGKELTKMKFSNDGVAWLYKKQKHRLDGPAVIYPDGKEMWYREGRLHRSGGPAVIYPDGKEEYYLKGIQYNKDQYFKGILKSRGTLTSLKNQSKIKNEETLLDDNGKKYTKFTLEDGTVAWFMDGKKHRSGGPAIIYPDGMEMWYNNNQRHRSDGPAIIWPNGKEEYYRHSQRHRLDGPAVIWADGKEEYYLDGINYTKEKYKKVILGLGRQIHSDIFTVQNEEIFINGDGKKCTKVTFKDNTVSWYMDGKRHRDDGPAIIYPDGTKKWYRRGRLHRLDGPAIIYSNGIDEWYRSGQRHRPNNKPAIIYPNGIDEWYRSGQRHRPNNKPAIIYPNGKLEYYSCGKLHREDGPAVIHHDKTEEFFLKGIQYDLLDYFKMIGKS